jgi:hypothetical protein
MARSCGREDVNTEDVESTALRAATRLRLVKTHLARAVVNCRVREFVLAL